MADNIIAIYALFVVIQMQDNLGNGCY